MSSSTVSSRPAIPPSRHNDCSAQLLHPSASQALENYRRVRGFTDNLIETLEPEDCTIQSMPDVSPTRWHLAHTTWFFETFVLRQVDAGYVSPNPQFEYLFNSYYNTVGKQFPRERRGVLSRPTLREVKEYRRSVDDAMERLIEQQMMPDGDSELWHRCASTVQLGLQHEQQHQELILTDIKHVLSCNPLQPAFQKSDRGFGVDKREPQPTPSDVHRFLPISGGVHTIGHDGEGFCYDNETPIHETLVHDYEIGDRLITNAQYLQFMEAGGYREPSLWLSAGWSTVLSQQWNAPLYWFQRDGQWFEFTLLGAHPLDLQRPVCHVSFYEAEAFARWADARLPTEMEWEVFASRYAGSSGAYGAFAGDFAWHPRSADLSADWAGPYQVFGDCWQWTASPYIGYPGFRPAAGAVGEYNGKFMCNQFVLRGGSVATSRDHIRVTYRNFFPPEARWQFSGIRLAR